MAVLAGLVVAVVLLAVAALPAVLLGVCIQPSRLRAAVERLPVRRRLRRDAEPVGPPIEQIAVQLRRLHAVLADVRPVSSVRRFGVERAYDEMLGKASLALGVQHHLDAVCLDEREFERLRVEALLQEAGLVLRGPVGGCLPGREPRRRDGRG